MDVKLKRGGRVAGDGLADQVRFAGGNGLSIAAGGGDLPFSGRLESTLQIEVQGEGKSVKARAEVGT